MQKNLDDKKYYIYNVVSEDGILYLKGYAALKDDTFVLLDVYINRVFYKTILTDELIEDDLYGFNLMLPEEVVFKEENLIEVKFHNTSNHIANSPLKYKHKAKYIFNVGHRTKERIGGWILDENFKNRTLKLQLFINNVFVMECENSDNRKDIEAIYGVLKAGFHFSIPEAYQNLEDFKIDIKVLEGSKLVNLLHESIIITSPDKNIGADVESSAEVSIEDKRVIAILGTPYSGLHQLTATLANNSHSSSWFLPYETRKDLTPIPFTDFASIRNQYNKAYPNEDRLKDTIIISEFISGSKNIEFIEESFKNLEKQGVKTKIIWLLRDVNYTYLSQNDTLLECIGKTVAPLNKDSYIEYIEFMKTNISN